MLKLTFVLALLVAVHTHLLPVAMMILKARHMGAICETSSIKILPLCVNAKPASSIIGIINVRAHFKGPPYSRPVAVWPLC